ncbi:MAG: PH domain-containing protein [Clostridium sp.]
MKTAEEMTKWYIENRNIHRMSMTDIGYQKLFKIIEKNLVEDEHVKMVFIGTVGEKASFFHPFWKFWGELSAYALTNRGIIVVNRSGIILIKKSATTVKLEYLNDITKHDRIFFSTINIDTIKETLNITLRKKDAEIFYAMLQQLISEQEKNNNNLNFNNIDNLNDFTNIDI